jgi:hypothetical protein
MKIKFIYATFKNLYFYGMKLITNFRWLFLAVVLFTGGQAHSQAIISLGRLIVPIPSSIVVNSVQADSLYIYNTASGDTFQGTIAIYLKVNDSLPFTYDSTNNAGISFDNGNSFAILPTDSVLALVHIHFDSTEFAAGPSVVVIWPIATPDPGTDPVRTGDTLTTDTITILETASISVPLPSGLKVYTQADQLFIQCSEPNALRHVRIFDVTGALVMEQDLSTSNSIPMGKYSDGIYLAELILNNGDKITYKVFSGR